MSNGELASQLKNANTFEEVKKIAADNPGIDAEKAWKEIQNHQSSKHEKLDLNELDAISGGADRDWQKEGCAATCEWNSWCGSNDYCVVWSVTYDNFWAKCPDGHEHVWGAGGYACVRCGYFSGQDHTSK